MSSQLTLDAAFDPPTAPEDNPNVVDDPEAVDWMDYHEFLRIRREREAAQ